MTLSPSSGISWQMAEAVRDKTIMDAGKRAQKRRAFGMGKQYFIAQMQGKEILGFQRIQERGKQTEPAAQAFNRRMMAYDRRINGRKEGKRDETQ